MKRLTQYDLEEYTILLLSLSEEDRLLRFGFPISNSKIEEHVQKIRDKREYVLVHGLWDVEHGLVAATELWFNKPYYQCGATRAEIGLVVSSKVRGKGYGKQMFNNVCVMASNLGVTDVDIFVKSHNRWMRTIASKHGMTIVSNEGGEIQYHQLYDGYPEYDEQATLAAVSADTLFKYWLYKITKSFNLFKL